MLLTNYTSDLKNYYNEIMHKRLEEESIPFWTYRGKKYVNKFQTIIDAQHDSFDKIRFNLFDKQFDIYDWSQYPDQTGEELYLERLKQLKEKYNYIRLGYSNGTDSQTIVDVAIKHNIHIDEFVVMYQKDDAYLQKTEISRIKKFINENQNKLKNTKITYIEFNINVFKFFLENILDRCGSTKIIDSPMNLDFYYKFGSKEVKNALWYPVEKGLTHCDLLGKEPPMIDKINGQYYFYMPDRLVGHHLSPWSEWFFTSAEFPKLHSYQIHKNIEVMKKYNLKRNEYMFCTEQQWKEMVKSTERFYHSDAYADKVRSGQRKTILRISNYMHDTDFKNILTKSIIKYKNLNHINVMFPRIAPMNHYSKFYSLEKIGGITDLKPLKSKRWELVKSKLKPEEETMYYSFKDYWNSVIN